MNLKTILIAPDKFKGSLTSGEVCSIIADALQLALPDIKIISIPLADGGEGSCELLTSFAGGSWVEVEVHDPLGRKIKTRYGLSADRTIAFLEMASASGLQLLSKDERNPLKTSTFGTGQMIRHALDQGVDKIIMGIGGSATNDGGMGMAHALGLLLYGASGEILNPNGGNLKDIHRVDETTVDPRLKEISFTVFCDVDNPLHGPQGAAQVFASQKGASSAEIIMLDEGLRHLEIVMRNHFGNEFNFPGAGAGGGLAVGLKGLTNLTLSSGMKFIKAFTGLDQRIAEVDLIITGEGQLDEQTLSGKVVKGVADLAVKHRKPVVVMAGKCLLTSSQLKSLGVTKVITLVGDDVDESRAINESQMVLRMRVQEKVISLVKTLSDARNP